jgi:hypothetical protein
MFLQHLPIDAMVESVNVRSEKHGKDEVLAFDAGLSFTLNAQRLNEFHPELRELFYLPPDQSQLPIEGESPQWTELRCPILKAPFGLVADQTGRNVIFEPPGLGDERDQIEVYANVNKWTVTPQAGGSVLITCRVQCNQVESDTLGDVCSMLRQVVGFAFSPSEEARTDEQPPKTEGDPLAALERAAQGGDATDAFLQGAADAQAAFGQ